MEHPLEPHLERRPVLLVIAGHDPSGAGVQADLETAAALGCRAASLITCLTIQNTRGVKAKLPTAPKFLEEQAAWLLEDLSPPAACKLGLIPTLEVLEAVLNILAMLPVGTPIILDPVLGASAGGPLSDSSMAMAIRERLLPLTVLSTPNLGEARRLFDNDGTPQVRAGSSLGWVLTTGADEPGNRITHRLHQADELFAVYHWPRLRGVFHGSGCTLASALAATIANGVDMQEAVRDAQEYTWQSLKLAFRPGMGQYIPDRLFWARDDEAATEATEDDGEPKT